MLGAIFTSRTGATARGPLVARYAAALDDVMLIAALVAFVAAGLAIVLIRGRDFAAT